MILNTATASRPRQRFSVALGPGALLSAGAIALAVTVAASTVAPGLAQHDHRAYNISGAAMSLSDLLVLVGVLALWRSDAVRPGWLNRFGFLFACVGTAGIVVAEAILRANYDTGNAVFGVVGPIQALGLVVVGVGVIVSRTWSGWRRFIVLLMGIYVPAVLIPTLTVGKQANLFALGGYHLIILMVGVAYWQEARRNGA